MRKWFGLLVVPTVAFGLTVSALAIGPAHRKGPEQMTVAAFAAPAPAAGLSEYQITSEYTDISAEEAWAQLAQAEAYKKLYEMQERQLREQLRLLEGPGAYYYYGSNEAAYTQLMELKNQKYALKLQKEQYEWQKKQAESCLKLLGEKPDRAQLEYAFYMGTAAVSGLSYEELCTRRLDLQLQEQQLKWQLESLEYQYQLEQLSDSAFASQYAALFRQKEDVKLQREQTELEIQLMFGQMGPGLGAGPGAALLP